MFRLQVVLQKLIHNRHTSIRELQQLTGRSLSTVYRWLSGQADPSWRDIQRMLSGMRSVTAQQEILRVFTSELPVAMMWTQIETPTKQNGHNKTTRDEIDLTLAAVHTATDLLQLQRQLVLQKCVSSETYQEMAGRVDTAINQLLTSRELTRTKASIRKNAISRHPF